MREEPQIFINGRPYVLRDELRPFKNMREYTGITASTLEKMEERFREDVLREAAENGGRVPVCKEGSGTAHGELELLWESVASPTSVQTAKDVFQSLCAAAGFDVDYHRVPVTDGQIAEWEDLERISEGVLRAPPNSALIFQCQQGVVRTTAGMVAGSLTRLFQDATVGAAGGSMHGWLGTSLQTALEPMPTPVVSIREPISSPGATSPLTSPRVRDLPPRLLCLPEA